MRKKYSLSSQVEENLENIPETQTIQEEVYIEALKRLEQKRILQKNEMLKKEQDQLDYFTLWVHQVKTPISSMRLHLQNEDSDLSRQLRSELNRIEQYTEMVLTYLRLDSNSSDYLIQKVDVDKILKSSVRKFSSEFINRKLSLDYQVHPYLVLSDEKWLAFVFEQILSNALKYTQCGKITIQQEKNEIIIEDTGIGIDSSDLSRVFEKGYTGFNGRMDKKASGIGLFLVKRICDNLQHDIWIESEAGKGTRVHILFQEKKIGIE
ncbi:MAG: sensor histidine kinase [Bacillota bacterium]|nr:sensor histidine kinase [Bacillota bacterium]